MKNMFAAFCFLAISSTAMAASPQEKEEIVDLLVKSLASGKCVSGLILSQKFDGGIVREVMTDLINAKIAHAGGSNTLNILDKKFKQADPANRIIQISKSDADPKIHFRQGGVYFILTNKDNSLTLALNDSSNFFCLQNK